MGAHTFAGYVDEVCAELLAPPADDCARVQRAIEHLREARELLKQAQCRRTADRVRDALSSAMGARRNVDYRATRARMAADAQAQAAADAWNARSWELRSLPRGEAKLREGPTPANLRALADLIDGRCEGSAQGWPAALRASAQSGGAA